MGPRFRWELTGRGWARCTIGDAAVGNSVAVTASFIAPAPEELLLAVSRIAQGAREARAWFAAEPGGTIWYFTRDGDCVTVRLVGVDDGHAAAPVSQVLWEGTYTVAALARGVLRGFDQVADAYGSEGYGTAWGRPFPEFEVRALRAAYRRLRAGWCRGSGFGEG
ncbi:hypothetical protein [Yinghuangia soli]|uniref:Uncharacterized protein n=1 Tax=Yinghuangia soli TaxID=2908204 RepID=A0AA41PYX7_9ACTN|nr:hypothetical protein [Yinghuangia soli]MCF2527706.1 hypothetical protein [Yinghuangia soli]